MEITICRVVVLLLLDVGVVVVVFDDVTIRLLFWLSFLYTEDMVESSISSVERIVLLIHHEEAEIPCP
jgi:hypothetical protein